MAYKVGVVFCGLVLAMALTGCDGEGAFVGIAKSGDVYGDGPTLPPGDGGVTPRPRPFAGTWITSFGDDMATNATPAQKFQYSAQMTLVQNDQSIKGVGRGSMNRVSREDLTPNESMEFRIENGSATNNDATLRFANTDAFGSGLEWQLRVADDRLVGIYTQTNSLGTTVVRSGHAVWELATQNDINGRWVAAVGDAEAVTGEITQNRTGLIDLSTVAANFGNGRLIVQEEGAPSSVSTFNVVNEQLDTSSFTIGFAEIDLVARPFRWWGYFSDSVLVAAYAQFAQVGGVDTPLRVGNAKWYLAPTPPTAQGFARTWVGSFQDSESVDGILDDYLAEMRLQVANNTFTGTASVRVESEVTTQPESFSVQDVVNTDSIIEISLEGSGRRFLLDLALADSILVGSYQQFDLAGRFVSRGSIELRPSTQPSLVGVWVAAYADTMGESAPPVTQLAKVNVTSQDTATRELAGVGTLMLADETTEKIFTLTGSAQTQEIEWVLSGGDPTGTITWHLRQAGRMLYGTYTHETNQGGIVARGQALWFRTGTPL